MDPEEGEDDEEPEMEGGEAVVGMYFMRATAIFNLKRDLISSFFIEQFALSWALVRLRKQGIR